MSPLHLLSAAFVLAACAERARPEPAAQPPATGATGATSATVAAPPAPATPVVDSAEAARRATVMDTAPVARRDSAVRAAVDTVKRPGAIGPKAGDRHLAFRGTGSDADSLRPVKTAPAPLPGSL